jgi:hypothetical protein
MAGEGNHKFGVGIVPVDGELRVGLLAKEAFEKTGQKNRSLNFIDDKHLYDDRDLPEVEVLPPDDDVRSNNTIFENACSDYTKLFHSASTP